MSYEILAQNYSLALQRIDELEGALQEHHEAALADAKRFERIQELLLQLAEGIEPLWLRDALLEVCNEK